MLKKLKRYYRLCGLCFAVGTIFWLAETLVFIYLEGWHWEANTMAERACDNIVEVLWTAGIVFFVFATMELLEMFANADVTTINEKQKS